MILIATFYLLFILRFSNVLHNCLRRIFAKLSRPYLSSAKVLASRSWNIRDQCPFQCERVIFFLEKLFYSSGSFYRGDDYFTTTMRRTTHFNPPPKKYVTYINALVPWTTNYGREGKLLAFEFIKKFIFNCISYILSY